MIQRLTTWILDSPDESLWNGGSFKAVRSHARRIADHSTSGPNARRTTLLS